MDEQPPPRRRSSRVATATLKTPKEEPVAVAASARPSTSRHRSHSHRHTSYNIDTVVKALTEVKLLNECDKAKHALDIKNDSPSMEHPKAIFIIGAAGAGKTFTLERLIPKTFLYEIYNPDIYQEYLLSKEGVLKRDQQRYSNNEAEFLKTTLEQLRQEYPRESEVALMQKAREIMLSKTYKWFHVSQDCTKEDFKTFIQKRQNIIIDRPGDKMYRPHHRGQKTKMVYIEDQKHSLERKGYQTFMIVIYANPLIVLKRNSERARRLPSHIISNIWIGVQKNMDYYKHLFGDALVVVDNDYAPPSEITEEALAPYFPNAEERIYYLDTFKKYTKPQTHRISVSKEKLSDFLATN